LYSSLLSIISVCFFGICWCAGPAADPGINSRALAELFQVAQQRDTEVVYSLSASVLEIYQEQIFDLLTGSKDTGELSGALCIRSRADPLSRLLQTS
jgi:hypothetical protein